MSVTIESVSITVCDANREPLPIDENSDGALARFRPSPLGTTGELFLRVVCVVDPAGNTQLRYLLRLINRAHFRYNGGDGVSITYYRNAESGQAIFLPLDIRNIVALSEATPADMELAVRDAAPNPPNEPKRLIRIKGFN